MAAAELAGAVDGLDGAVDAVTAAFREALGQDPAAAATGELVMALYRVQAKLGAVVAGAVAAFERSQAWQADGARSAVAWLAVNTRLPKSQLKRDVRLGRAVADRLPACGAAWAAGTIAEAHVATLARLGDGRVEEQLALDEAMLVEQAETLPFRQFHQVAEYWEQLADADGCDAAEERRRCRRDVTLVESMDGMWLGQMTLDPVSGSIVSGELTRLERQLFQVDWSVARDELGREPTVGELARTPAQRRADALVEMATRSGSAPAGARRPRPLFTVLVDWPGAVGRICELASGQVVAPGGLVRWLGEADFERVVFGPAGRVEVGRTARLFSGASRRAVEVRDRICAHPFCDEPVSRCEADHIEPYALGGPTTLDNGRLLCSFHNRQRSKPRRPGGAPPNRRPPGPPPPTRGAASPDPPPGAASSGPPSSVTSGPPGAASSGPPHGTASSVPPHGAASSGPPGSVTGPAASNRAPSDGWSPAGCDGVGDGDGSAAGPEPPDPTP